MPPFKSRTHKSPAFSRIELSIHETLTAGANKYDLFKLQDIPYEVVVLIEARKIIMAAAMNSDQGDPAWIKFLQRLAVPDRDQPVPRPMQNIGMTFHRTDPFIGPQEISKDEPDGKNGQKPFDDPQKIEIRGIENEVARIIIGSKFGGEPAPDTATVNDQVIFRILFF